MNIGGLVAALVPVFFVLALGYVAGKRNAFDANQAAGLSNQSEKVTILGGAGCVGAHAELIELAGKLNAPIVHALRGKEFIEYDNPFDVGMTGLLGFSPGYHAMMNCTTLLMVGTDFPYQQFFPKHATVVQIVKLKVRASPIIRQCC